MYHTPCQMFGNLVAELDDYVVGATIIRYYTQYIYY